MKNVSQTVARLYAEALNGIGESEGNLPRIVEDLHAVQEIYDQRGDFFEFFTSPRIEPHEKKRILDEALKEKVDRTVLGLLHVLIDKRRELYYDNIVGEFYAVRDMREGVLNAYVTAARPMEPDHVGDIVQRLEKISGKKIKLHEKVDPELLGGLRIKVGDYIVDGTLRHRLALLRRELVVHRE